MMKLCGAVLDEQMKVSCRWGWSCVWPENHHFGGGSDSEWLHAARAERLSARTHRAMISSIVAMSNLCVEPARSNLSRTNLKGLNNLN
jgi:hypothetical protein